MGSMQAREIFDVQGGLAKAREGKFCKNCSRASCSPTERDATLTRRHSSSTDDIKHFIAVTAREGACMMCKGDADRPDWKKWESNPARTKSRELNQTLKNLDLMC